MEWLRMFGIEGDFNEWELIWPGMPHGWWAVLLILGVVLALWWSYLTIARAQRKHIRILLYVLRTFAVVFVLMLFLRPSIELRKVLWRKTHIAILVDASKSMTLPSIDDKKRFEIASEWFKQHQDEFKELSNKYYLDFFKFSSTVGRTNLDELISPSAPKGARTGIYTALSDIASRYPQEDLAGIVVLSDGCDNVGYPQEFLSSKEKCKLPTGCETPIFSIYPESGSSTTRDLAITGIQYDDFAFVHNSVEIDVELLLSGFSKRNIPILLKRGNTPVANKNVMLTPGNPSKVTLKFKPNQVGRALYEVSVPILDGEKITSNNSRMFMLKVIRDKVRVLQVAGRPDWDERFLRRYLKKNPNVDLISFFILRTMDDNYWVPENELSLIPFPTDELFNTQLHTFDLVIFQNFSYRGYQMASYLDNIAQFVRNGGAFLMVGGELSFAAGGYAHTEIEDIMPVKILPKQDAFSTEPFSLELTPEGEKHPIMQLDRDIEKNRSLWLSMPKLFGINTGLIPYDDAIILAKHPTLTEYGQKEPVIAIRRVGKGRSMIVAADTTWLWNFDMVRRGQTPFYYNKFWSNAIRWLIKDPDLEQIQIIPSKDKYSPGENITLSIRVLDENLLPAEGVDVNLRWIDSTGKMGVGKARTGEGGIASYSFKAPSNIGALRIKASVETSDEITEETEELVLIDEGGEELSRLDIDKALLSSLASASGGKMFSTGKSVDLTDLDWASVRSRRIADRTEIPLWDNWIVVITGILLFSLLWWIGRRNRIP